jgi:hypothetical protein
MFSHPEESNYMKKLLTITKERERERERILRGFSNGELNDNAD